MMPGALLAFWSRRQQLGMALFAVSLLGAALGLGAVHPPVLLAVAVCQTVAAALCWWDCRGHKPRRGATALAFLAAGLTLYTALQAVPLPSGIVQVLAPPAAEVWARALEPLREAAPAMYPLSLDPGATKLEVLRGVCYLLAFLTTLQAAARREGTQALCVVIVVASVVVAVATLLHPAFGAQRVFGVYRPEIAIDERHLSPLLNPNPLAAYLNVGICVALAFLVAPRTSVPKPLVAAALTLLLATQLWVASRGGILCTLLGAGLVIAMVRRGGNAHRLNTSGIVAGLLVAAGVAMLVLAGSGEALSELGGTDVSKLTMQKQMLPLIARHPWFGVGRGAFEAAYPSVRQGSGYVLFTHPEHVVVQFAAEWGVPVAVVALAVIGWALRPRVAAARSQLVVGPWAALCAGAVHNLLDLNSEVPAVMLVYVTCAGLVVAGSGGGVPSRVDAWAMQPRRLAIAASIAGIAAISLVVPVIGHDLYSDRQKLRAQALSAADDAVVAGLARAAMLRHPAEAYLPFVVALRLSRSRGLDAVPWIARTLELSPVCGPAHMVLARVLRRVNVKQARLEYRLAVTDAPEMLGHVLPEALQLVGDYDDLLELAPERARDQLIEQAVPALARRLPGTAAMLDLDLVSRHPTNVKALTRLAKRSVAALVEESPWCETRAGCLETAKRDTGKLVEQTPRRCEGYVLRALAMARAGAADDAVLELSRVTDSVDDPSACLTGRLQIALRASLGASARDAIERLARAPCADPAECAANLVTAGEAEAFQGNLERAAVLFRKAHDRVPEDDVVLERVASTSSRLGLHVEALDLYTQLARRHPEVARFADQVERERGLVGGRLR